jgi:hypothetical protein
MACLLVPKDGMESFLKELYFLSKQSFIDLDI